MTTIAPSQTIDLAIVGGGIAGVAFAIALQKYSHIKVTIYEAAHKFGEIGAGVVFGPNALVAMERINPKLRAIMEVIGTHTAEGHDPQVWMSVRRGMDGGPGKEWGTLITDVRMGEGQLNRGTLRSQFLDATIHLLPEGIAHFAKRAVKLEDVGADGVKIHFKDGTEAVHHIVVGCDGIHSAVRKYIVGDGPEFAPKFSQDVCHRTIMPVEEARRILGDELTLSNQMLIGHHGHIVSVPVDGGKVTSLTMHVHRDSWPYEKEIVQGSREELHKDYESWGSKTHELIDGAISHDVWALFDYAESPAPTYTKDKVVIIGDAAHATTPHQGSGAGMAIEDAQLLSSLLGLTPDEKGVVAAFKAYDIVRRPRTYDLMITSRETASLWGCVLPGVMDDSDAIKKNADQRMKWIFDYDFDAELKEAVEIMKKEAVSA